MLEGSIVFKIILKCDVLIFLMYPLFFSTNNLRSFHVINGEKFH